MRSRIVSLHHLFGAAAHFQPVTLADSVMPRHRSHRGGALRSANKHLNHTLFSADQRCTFSSVSTQPLPVIDSMLKKALGKGVIPSLKRTAVLYIHHSLKTSVNVIDAILGLGVMPEHFFVLDKHYSQCSSVVEQVKQLKVHYRPCSKQTGLGKFSLSFTQDINLLWSDVMTKIMGTPHHPIDNIFILDHGGRALAFTPDVILKKYNVVGVEKTTAGLINLDKQGLPPFPLIGVATCAAKKFLESPLIAEAVVKKLEPLIPIENPNLTCGVVGYGSVGKAVAAKLISMGHKVIVYDTDAAQTATIHRAKNVAVTKELSALVAASDLIFGCTGRDIATSIDHFRLSSKNKTLISCSSEDIEFLSLLQEVQQKNNGRVAKQPLATVEYISDMGATITILRGGFPINFDESGESVPANDIQLTRALVLGGVLQATELLKKRDILSMGGVYALDADMQKFIVTEWFKYQSHNNRVSKSTKRNFQNCEWIANNSGGEVMPSLFGVDLSDNEDSTRSFTL